MTEHAGTKHFVSRSLYKALKENERAERGYFIAVAHTHTHTTFKFEFGHLQV